MGPHTVQIALIAAVAKNGVIGSDGQLPWRLPEDLRRFKRLTMGKPIVMGRATYESIGRPLPGRNNIVLSTDAELNIHGCTVAHSVDAALAAAEGADEVMIIGGGEIYRQFLPLADRIYLTRVHADVPGDAYFPELEERRWRALSVEDGGPSDLAVTYVTLERRNP